MQAAAGVGLRDDLRNLRKPGMLLQRTGEIVVPRLAIALGSVQRMRGLLGRTGLAEDEALLIPRCGSIHMFFMRFAIDAVFLSAHGTVLKVCENLKPWRLAFCAGADCVLEAPAFMCRKFFIQDGDVLRLVEQGMKNE